VLLQIQRRAVSSATAAAAAVALLRASV